MSDPIGAIRLGVSGTQQTGGPDGARRYEFDIGKGRPEDGPTFGDTLTRAISGVSDAQDRAADSVQQFLRGEPIELHQVMAASTEAGLALDLLVEMRNKVTEAFRTLINMQS
jgi:flagellar hook-basal body complex protein FliE